jgi:hypothetical protein
MNPDFIVGLILLLFGVAFSGWAVLKRAGGVTVFIGLCTSLMGLAVVVPGLIPAGPVKTAAMGFFLAVAVIALIVSVARNRRGAPNQRVR